VAIVFFIAIAGKCRALTEKTNLNGIFEKSAIIVAHPDDEALWFSSILNSVGQIVICFLNYKTKHQKSQGRKRALAEYPKKNMTCLGLEESDSFWDTDWRNPETTPFGLKVAKGPRALDYRNNYHQLKKELGSGLKGFSTVFTHNAWGEYGHNEHVQVYRVLRELQKEMHYDLWCSNYCSNKSFQLMTQCVSDFNGRYLSFKTNKNTAHSLKALYETNGCWSWFPNHEWLEEESFLHGETGGNVTARLQLFPLNFIKLELEPEPQQPSRTSVMAKFSKALKGKVR
jgi:hypothetical protein